MSLGERKTLKKNKSVDHLQNFFGYGLFTGRRRRKSLQASLFYYRYFIFNLRTTEKKSSSLATDRDEAFTQITW